MSQRPLASPPSPLSWSVSWLILIYGDREIRVRDEVACPGAKVWLLLSQVGLFFPEMTTINYSLRKQTRNFRPVSAQGPNIQPLPPPTGELGGLFSSWEKRL